MTDRAHDTDRCPADEETTDPGGHVDMPGGTLCDEAQTALYIVLRSKVDRCRAEVKDLKSSLAEELSRSGAERDKLFAGMARVESLLADVVGTLDGAIGQWRSLGGRVTALESRVDRLEAAE